MFIHNEILVSIYHIENYKNRGYRGEYYLIHDINMRTINCNISTYYALERNVLCNRLYFSFLISITSIYFFLLLFYLPYDLSIFTLIWQNGGYYGFTFIKKYYTNIYMVYITFKAIYTYISCPIYNIGMCIQYSIEMEHMYDTCLLLL